ncbi:MAG: DAK2 domain-containing protein [Lachnospiraceae bacterium]|nr:DAK2 domain-containing protein [Lachnospiraceae bacterium]
MTINTIDAALLRRAFLAGAKSIEAKKEYINELNVFPVPDGDTGTNMTLTIMMAANEVNQMADPDMKSLAKTISSASLRGARGNSGVILSQLLRGFTKVVQDHETLNMQIISEAFDRAVATAYKAVMQPKEGTILTVARGGAEKCAELAGSEDIIAALDEVLKYMEEVLEQTPELLPVLKEAGVVDSGGQGLLEFMKGVKDGLLGKEINFDAPASDEASKDEDVEENKLKYTYNVSFNVKLERPFEHEDEIKFRSFLESVGASIELNKEEGNFYTGLYTNDPGLALQKAVKYGQLVNVKVENMKADGKDLAAAPKKEETPASEPVKKNAHKKDGFVAVSVGAGLNKILTELGVDVIIEGGQTMNPSTNDVLSAIEKVDADNVYVLPNNKNIILAAEQAASLCEAKNVVVVPTKTVPQGITALINYMYDKTPEENLDNMMEAVAQVKTGQVTYSVRDTSIDGKEIKLGDIMGLDDKTVRAVGNNVPDTAFELIKEMMFDDTELVTLYYGENTSEEDAAALSERIMNEYPDVEVEIHAGNQPVYYYVISVE